MGLLNIAQAMIGLAFALFVPGYLLSLILFDKVEVIERIMLSIALSVCIDIIIGLFLGVNKTIKELTGGITAGNIWFYLVVICVILGFILIVKKRKNV